MQNRRCLYVLCALSVAMGLSCQKSGLRDMDRVRNYVCLSGPPTMRVSVLRDVADVTVSVAGAYRIVEAQSQRVIRDGNYLPPTRIAASQGAFRIGDASVTETRLRILCADPAGITLRDVPYQTEVVKEISYRGEVEIRRKGEKMDVLNIVDMETYLAGVLGSEMPLNWPEAALGAQAIVSRTYAIFQKKVNSAKDYDVVATISDQKYLGTKAEDYRSRRIVDATHGIVLFFENHLFPTYFHSTCGGKTEDVSFVLESRSIKPLSGTVCPYCGESKYAKEWVVRIKDEEIRAKLAASPNRVNVGKILSIEPYEYGPGGRPSMLRIVHTGGTTTMRAYPFRLAMGSTKLFNTKFTVVKVGDTFEFRGVGYGHGVGMCQYGAMGLAKSGKSAIDIVEYYYPGADVVRIY